MKEELLPLTKLIDARNDMKLTQEEFAKLAGISRSMYSNIERGKYTPSLKAAYAIAKVAKKPIEYLFFNLNARKSSKQTA
jgi:putative transcriptional regulator